MDRLKIAQRLSDQRPAHLAPLNICLQVNVSAEDSKSGCSPEELPELARAVSALPNLKLRGLMAIPEPTDDVAAQHAAFARLRQLRDDLALDLDTLSMGMKMCIRDRFFDHCVYLDQRIRCAVQPGRRI